MDELNEEDIIVDVKAIGERYEDKGYFSRLKDMFVGLGMPRNTPEYKIARTELERQQAPLIAFVSVILFVVVLIIGSQIETTNEEEIIVTQLQEPQKQDEPAPEDEPPPPPDPEPVNVDVEIDVQTPGPPTEITPIKTPPTKQVSTKPAPVNAVLQSISPVKLRSMLGVSRNTGVIGKLTSGGSGYGDPTTEANVLKVLWWLKDQQSKNGSWDKEGNALANTALAVLTYLAHGEYPGSSSPYKKDFGPVVLNAVKYLIGRVKQTPNGVRMEGSDDNEYAFLIATYALCEAYGMTRNPDIKDVAYLCLDRIVKGQSATGGWEYKLDRESTRDDLSFAGWALQALKAGKMAGLEPKGLDVCIKKAVRCLQTRNFKPHGGFHYTAEDNYNWGLTATGCLAMQLLGYGGSKEVAKALEFMRSWKPSFKSADLVSKGGHNPGNSPQYYCYYATQCKYQAGMKEGASKNDETAWYEWNKAMKKLYSSTIINISQTVKDWSGQEHKQGYYKNVDGHTSRPYMDTCLVALQLMVYYRYLPTTQTSAAKENTAGKEAVSVKAVDSGDVGVGVDF